MVVEACVRLMRAGWVELSHDTGAIAFKATTRGADAARHSELPTVLERKRRPISYIIDLVAGDVFRNHELVVTPEYEVRERLKNERYAWIVPESIRTTVDGNALIDALLEEDETFVDAEPSGLVRRYAVVTVGDGVIDGLPSSRDLKALKAAILSAASRVENADGAQATLTIPGPRAAVNERPPEPRSIAFQTNDLILDGEAHKQLLTSIFANAKSRVFVHSTFIDAEKFLSLLSHIESAVQRGVRIHVFWGQNEESERVVSTQAAIAVLRVRPEIANLSDSLIFHPFSTGSHAKLIVADCGPGGQYIAVIGSCNWFTSSFSSYEVSVRLRDPLLVRDVVRYVSQLSCLHDGVWSDLASELVSISQRLSTATVTGHRNARACVVVGAQHNHFVLRARDEAKKRAFVLSHRLGAVSEPAIVVPLIAATKARRIDARIFYGRIVRPVRAKTERALASVAGDHGVELKAIESPRLHAKILGWDDDAVLITSLNWLSADPSDLHSLKEIGVWIEATSAASYVYDDFQGRSAGPADRSEILGDAEK